MERCAHPPLVACVYGLKIQVPALPLILSGVPRDNRIVAFQQLLLEANESALMHHLRFLKGRVLQSHRYHGL